MSKNDEGIYKVDTVPPPHGEEDAYNAPTRVGVLASAIVGELLAQGEREGAAPENEVKTAPPPAPPPEVVADAADDEPAGPVVSPLRVSTPPPPAPAPEAKTPAADPAAEGGSSRLPLVALAVVLVLVALYFLARN